MINVGLVLLCSLFPDFCEARAGEVCWSVTHYWPFNSEGELAPLQGQADSDPSRTATGQLIYGERQAGSWVAGPEFLLGDEVCLSDGSCFPVLDTFGYLTLRRGLMYHPGYDQIVIGIDVFTPSHIAYLDCGGIVK